MVTLNIIYNANSQGVAYLDQPNLAGGGGNVDNDSLPPPTLQCGLFTGDWGDSKPGVRRKSGHSINLSYDSWIICFTGSRGSGKTTTMTLFAIKEAICNKRRVVSSYPIEFNVLFPGNGIKNYKFEILDWEKLLTFDDEYKNCLILLDEAPDALSNLASMTWKNRLVNIFVRQIRKNRNSLFLAAQALELVDKSIRWQVDIEMACQDASRRYGWPPSERGKVILVQALDWSGQWTGQTWQERARYGGAYGPNFNIYPRVLWGIPGKTKAAFDSWGVQDIWESLSKVDMKLNRHQIGPGANKNETSGVFRKAAEIITDVIGQGHNAIETKAFFKSLGDMSASEKDALAKKLHNANVVKRRIGDKRYYFVQDFDSDKFSERN